jgi:hypothetical protein
MKQNELGKTGDVFQLIVDLLKEHGKSEENMYAIMSSYTRSLYGQRYEHAKAPGTKQSRNY